MGLQKPVPGLANIVTVKVEWRLEVLLARHHAPHITWSPVLTYTVYGVANCSYRAETSTMNVQKDFPHQVDWSDQDLSPVAGREKLRVRIEPRVSHTFRMLFSGCSAMP